jgi:hypothetical protein
VPVRKAGKSATDKRAGAARRKQKSRRRKKLLALGYECIEELWLPPEIKAAWMAREQISSAGAPPATEHFESDIIDILIKWSDRWLRAGCGTGHKWDPPE